MPTAPAHEKPLLTPDGRRNVALGLLLAILAWNSLDYITYERIRTDSGVFLAGSMHILAGKVLYRDVWDHKPPMIYLINTAAQIIGGDPVRAIRVCERLFACAAALLFFSTVLVVFGRRWLAFVSAAVFLLHFHRPPVLQGGNFSEEYGAIFALAGVFTAVMAGKEGARRPLLLAAVSGLLFSCAAFTKEPFLLSSAPWFAWLVLRKMGTDGIFRHRKIPSAPILGAASPPVESACVFSSNRKSKIENRKSLALALLFLAGSLLPLLAFLLYFALNGGLREWLDVVSYNLNYVSRWEQPQPLPQRAVANYRFAADRVFSVSLIFRILFLAGLVSLVVKPFRARYGLFPPFALGWFAMDYWGTMLSPRGFGHYYLQLVPSYVMVCVCGIAWILQEAEKRRKVAVPVLVAALALLILAADHRPVGDWARRLIIRSAAPRIGPISDYIRRNAAPGDTLWCNWQRNSRFYVETGLLSPTKYIFTDFHLFIDTVRSTGPEKLASLKRDLSDRPPRFIIISGDKFLKDNGVLDWVYQHYREVPVSEPGGVEYRGEVYLYERNASAQPSP